MQELSQAQRDKDAANKIAAIARIEEGAPFLFLSVESETPKSIRIQRIINRLDITQLARLIENIAEAHPTAFAKAQLFLAETAYHNSL